MTTIAVQIDEYINRQSDWQKTNLESFRTLIHEVVPSVEEAWKWDVPVFLAGGKLLCAMSTFKLHTKYNFFSGAMLQDNAELFNNGLASKRGRAIDLKDGDSVDKQALADLIRQAADLVQTR